MHKRILAIDYGEKRIGLAISDEYGKFALPYEAIENKNLKFVVDEIEKIIETENIGKIVVGLPKSLKDGEVRNKSLDKFIANLRQISSNNQLAPNQPPQPPLSGGLRESPTDKGGKGGLRGSDTQEGVEHGRLCGLEIILFDERMSSKAADTFQIKGDERKSGWRDKIAATIILQDYLDYEQNIYHTGNHS